MEKLNVLIKTKYDIIGEAVANVLNGTGMVKVLDIRNGDVTHEDIDFCMNNDAVTVMIGVKCNILVLLPVTEITLDIPYNPHASYLKYYNSFKEIAPSFIHTLFNCMRPSHPMPIIGLNDEYNE